MLRARPCGDSRAAWPAAAGRAVDALPQYEDLLRFELTLDPWYAARSELCEVNSTNARPSLARTKSISAACSAAR